jgi:hypothetical protein
MSIGLSDAPDSAPISQNRAERLHDKVETARRKRRRLARNLTVLLVSASVVMGAVEYLFFTAAGSAYAAQVSVHSKPTRSTDVGTVVIYGSVTDLAGSPVAAIIEIDTHDKANHEKVESINAPDGTYRLVVLAGDVKVTLSTLAKGHKVKGRTRFEATAGNSYDVSAQVERRPKSFFFVPFSSY